MVTALLLFPELFKVHLKDTGLNLPSDFKNYNPSDYPHWHVFQFLYRGRPMELEALIESAEILASINDQEIIRITLDKLIERGISY